MMFAKFSGTMEVTKTDSVLGGMLGACKAIYGMSRSVCGEMERKYSRQK